MVMMSIVVRLQTRRGREKSLRLRLSSSLVNFMDGNDGGKISG